MGVYFGSFRMSSNFDTSAEVLVAVPPTVRFRVSGASTHCMFKNDSRKALNPKP